jgi:hypothetical protein
MSDDGKDQVWISKRSEIDESDAIGELVRQAITRLQRQARLAHPARTGQAEQADVLASESLDDLLDFDRPAQEWGRLRLREGEGDGHDLALSGVTF